MAASNASSSAGKYSRPLSSSERRFPRQRLRRLHRKLAVIDARVAFVGGINVIDDMHTPGHTPPRFDYAVRIEGPLLESIHAAARRLCHPASAFWVSFRHADTGRGHLVVDTDEAPATVRPHVNSASNSCAARRGRTPVSERKEPIHDQPASEDPY